MHLCPSLSPKETEIIQPHTDAVISETVSLSKHAYLTRTVKMGFLDIETSYDITKQ